jgi:hypothetical protein
MNSRTHCNTRATLQYRVCMLRQAHGENAGRTYGSVGETCDGTVHKTIAHSAITRYIKDAGCARHRPTQRPDDGAEH